MSKSKNSIAPARTYEDSSEKMNNEKTRAAVKRINQMVGRMFAIGKNIEAEGVELANLGIQLGFLFQTATGRDQLEFYLFDQLPDLTNKVSFDLAQRAVSLVNRYGPEHRFQTFAEAQPELKSLFPILGMVDRPHREQIGAPATMDWGSWIPTQFTSLNKNLQELFRDEPVQDWQPDRCETFLAQTEYIEQKRGEVKLKLGV